jgi:hypothetical protein
LEAKECLTPHINLKDLRASITQVWETLSKDYIVKIEAMLAANGKQIE